MIATNLATEWRFCFFIILSSSCQLMEHFYGRKEIWSKIIPYPTLNRMKQTTHDSEMFPALIGSYFGFCMIMLSPEAWGWTQGKQDRWGTLVRLYRARMTFQESLAAENYCELLVWKALIATMIQETRSNYIHLKRKKK